MKYNYDKLWAIMKERKMSKTELRLQSGISTNMLAKMGKKEPVTLEVLGKISHLFACGLDDLIEITE